MRRITTYILRNFQLIFVLSILMTLIIFWYLFCQDYENLELGFFILFCSVILLLCVISIGIMGQIITEATAFGLVSAAFLSINSIVQIILMYAAAYKGFWVYLSPKDTIKPPIEFLYFSIVTWTTLGYGDIVPPSPIVKMLAASEAMVGYIFMSLLISVFVALMNKYSNMHFPEN